LRNVKFDRCLTRETPKDERSQMIFNDAEANSKKAKELVLDEDAIHG